MGCVHGTKILTEEDIDFIAKNTAMDKTQVEVGSFFKKEINLIVPFFSESVPKFSEKASGWKNLTKVFSHYDERMLPRGGHRKT